MITGRRDPYRLAGADDAAQRAFLFAAVEADAKAVAVLETARALALPDAWLVAGAIYQNVWNALTGRPPGHGIKDYDIAYFDAADLSYEAEDAVIARCAPAFAGLGAAVEVKNQARVHLWYEARFGAPYAPLSNATESLQRYAADAHRVAVRLGEAGGLDLAAPCGLDAIFRMEIRPARPEADTREFRDKARRQAAIWPELHLSAYCA